MTSNLLSVDYDWLVNSPKLDLLLEFAEQGPAPWSKLDFRELLLAQLDMPIAETRESTNSSPDAAGLTLRDQLVDATTSLEALIAIKNQAKGWMRAADALPREVALVIYLMSIAAIALHHGRVVTRLSNSVLIQQVSWALAQHWIEPDLRTFLRTALVPVLST
jgi:hypothetical protein